MAGYKKYDDSDCMIVFTPKVITLYIYKICLCKYV